MTILRPGNCKPANCSLREAFLTANERNGHDRVVLARGKYRMERPRGVGLGEDGSWFAYDVTIRGQGPSETTLDAKDLDTAIQLGNDLEPNSMQALKVTGGRSTIVGAAGGILSDPGGKMTFRNVLIAGNSSAAGSGGGARLEPAIETRIINSRIIGNEAPNGGGVYLASGSAGQPTATIRNSTIRGNIADFGGGIYSRIASLTVGATTDRAQLRRRGWWFRPCRGHGRRTA